MVSNYMADLPQGISEQMSIIFLTKLFPMNFLFRGFITKKLVSLIQLDENTNPVELTQVRWVHPNSLHQKEKFL